ncbi:MAG: DUF1501 domain-containing protein, partial [Chthonomonadales bacterium]
MNRREFLFEAGGGLGGIALACLLGEEQTLAQTGLPNGIHHSAKAKRVVQLFMSGAASQCDTFDYKPELIARRGQKFDPGGKIELFQSAPGVVMPSPWDWKPRGKSGIYVSDLVPHIADCADDIAFINSMVSKSNVHGPATFMQNTGFVLPGFPSMGGWITYGLGSMNQSLPTFVVLPDSRGVPPNGPANWGAGFLPAANQGTAMNPGSKVPINDLFAASNPHFNAKGEKAGLDLLQTLNRDHGNHSEPHGQADPLGDTEAAGPGRHTGARRRPRMPVDEGRQSGE